MAKRPKLLAIHHEAMESHLEHIAFVVTDVEYYNDETRGPALKQLYEELTLFEEFIARLEVE